MPSCYVLHLLIKTFSAMINYIVQLHIYMVMKLNNKYFRGTTVSKSTSVILMTPMLRDTCLVESDSKMLFSLSHGQINFRHVSLGHSPNSYCVTRVFGWTVSTTDDSDRALKPVSKELPPVSKAERAGLGQVLCKRVTASAHSLGHFCFETVKQSGGRRLGTF